MGGAATIQTGSRCPSPMSVCRNSLSQVENEWLVMSGEAFYALVGLSYRFIWRIRVNVTDGNAQLSSGSSRVYLIVLACACIYLCVALCLHYWIRRFSLIHQLFLVQILHVNCSEWLCFFFFTQTECLARASKEKRQPCLINKRSFVRSKSFLHNFQGMGIGSPLHSPSFFWVCPRAIAFLQGETPQNLLVTIFQIV